MKASKQYWMAIGWGVRLALPFLMLPLAAVGAAQRLAQEREAGKLEVVATFSGPMPTGVAVSRAGRIFINYPRWGDDVKFTVAEMVNGKPVAYPSAELNEDSSGKPSERLIAVQSVVVDPKDRLWILDTGSIEFKPAAPGAAKLVGVDLKTNTIFKTIVFPPETALPTTYLNDVRFDLRRGKDGMAFITDSSDKGPNGIIVVDLASGRSWRRLNDHPSTKADKNYLPMVEGRPLLARPEPGTTEPLTIGSDGIAISPDGKLLYYCPLVGRRLYSVSVDALADEKMDDAAVAKTVEDLGDKGGASDGLESDAEGRIYLTHYEHNAIVARQPDGRLETLAHDPRLLWPDTLSVAADGHLYITANQLHRQKRFNEGKDLREQPYVLFRIPIAGRPIADEGRAEASGASRTE